MKANLSLALMIVCLGIPALVQAQAGTTLLVKTDMNCTWKLDGQPMPSLDDDDARVVLVEPGEHVVEAATVDGAMTVRSKVKVGKNEATVAFHFRNQYDRQAKLLHPVTPSERANAALTPTWTDPATHLTWTRRDNGFDVNFQQAGDYCADLQLAGGGWRLPTSAEMEAIYDRSVSVRTKFDNSVTYSVHIKGDLKLTGWEWSSTPGPEHGLPLHFVFDRPTPGEGFPREFGYSMRALCVRRAG